MDSMNIQRKQSIIGFLIIPTFLSAHFAATGKLTVFAAYLVSLIISVAVSPKFRGRENYSMFALFAVSSIPANLYVIVTTTNTELVIGISDGIAIIGILWGVLLYALLFSLEQIAMGLIVRAFWPNQLYDDDASASNINGDCVNSVSI